MTPPVIIPVPSFRVIIVDERGTAYPVPEGRTMNQPTAQGYFYGGILSDAFEKYRETFFKLNPGAPERCFTCAFRRGTDANGTIETVGAISECLKDGMEFRCHERDRESPTCQGFNVVDWGQTIERYGSR